jgi:hypothetical protein
MFVNVEIVKDFWDIVASFGVLIVGCITAYVAYKQHKTDKDKLKLDLYEKRFKVFQAIMELNSKIFRDANISISDLQIFLASTREANFLFDDDIKKFIEELYQKAIRLRFVEERLGDQRLPVGNERTKFANESHEILTWFGEIPRKTEKKFEKYLSLKNI